MGCIRSGIAIVCVRLLLAFVNLSLFLLRMNVVTFLKSSAQVLIAKVISYPPAELETPIQLGRQWASESELTMAGLVSQPKLSKGLEERRGKNDGDLRLSNSSRKQTFPQ